MYSLENEAVITSNRTRVEILASILNVAERATLKTHIMYKANLSHRQLEKYLTFLQDNDMLSQFTDEETGRNRISEGLLTPLEHVRRKHSAQMSFARVTVRVIRHEPVEMHVRLNRAIGLA